MPPEQVGLDPQRGDWRSDQFVIGLLLYRLATGESPFPPGPLPEVWRAPAVHAVPDPSSVDAVSRTR